MRAADAALISPASGEAEGNEDQAVQQVGGEAELEWAGQLGGCELRRGAQGGGEDDDLNQAAACVHAVES